jgi:hypothetical protein
MAVLAVRRAYPTLWLFAITLDLAVPAVRAREMVSLSLGAPSSTSSFSLLALDWRHAVSVSKLRASRTWIEETRPTVLISE